MALGEFTKQIAQQALLSATQAPKEAPAAAAPDAAASSMVAQIAAMQKQLKEDEELVVWFLHGGERIRVMEVYLPSAQVVVLTGLDSNRVLTRVISAAGALQLVCKTAKAAPGMKPVRVGLATPKT